MKRTIIGVLGQAGVGKDTMADYLVERYGFTKISLADPLKRVCREVYDFSETQLWGPSAERNKPDLRYPDGKGGYLTPRKALQTLGTEWGRAMWDDTWISYGLRMARKVLIEGCTYVPEVGALPLKRAALFLGIVEKSNGVVIPDIRFRNEAKAIMDDGGIVVRVKRDVPGPTGGIAGHASEEEQKSIHDAELNGGYIQVPDGIENYKRTIDTWIRKPSLGIPLERLNKGA